jgi:hypothetical protein
MTGVSFQENLTVGYHKVKGKSMKSRYVTFSNSVKVFLFSNDKCGAEQQSTQPTAN